MIKKYVLVFRSKQKGKILFCKLAQSVIKFVQYLLGVEYNSKYIIIF